MYLIQERRSRGVTNRRHAQTRSVEGRPGFEIVTEHPEEYMIVFEAIPEGDAGEEYLEIAAEMNELVEKQDGFVEIDRARSVYHEGRLFSVSRWESEEAIDNWYENNSHQAAQKMGRERLFKSFRISRVKVLKTMTMNWPAPVGMES
jgi:heme-degrading monooxygenase HmoA